MSEYGPLLDVCRLDAVPFDRRSDDILNILLRQSAHISAIPSMLRTNNVFCAGGILRLDYRCPGKGFGDCHVPWFHFAPSFLSKNVKNGRNYATVPFFKLFIFYQTEPDKRLSDRGLRLRCKFRSVRSLGPCSFLRSDLGEPAAALDPRDSEVADGQAVFLLDPSLDFRIGGTFGLKACFGTRLNRPCGSYTFRLVDMKGLEPMIL